MPPRDYLLIAGTATTELTVAIGRILGTPVSPCRIERFPDGEVSVEIDESVRRRDVVIVQSTAPPVNDNLMELVLVADACRRAAASHITAVVPYFGYARSDRRAGRRAPVAATAAATILESSGIGHVVTVDVHSTQLEGFFRIATDDVGALHLFDDSIRPLLAGNGVIVAPDFGAVRRAGDVSRRLGTEMAVCIKRRHTGTDVEVMGVVGDVSGRACVVVDDMISTGGTVAEAARALRIAGARGVTAVVATHGVFSPGAAGRLADAGVVNVFVTDSVRQPSEWPASPARQVVSIAPLLARVITRIESGESLRALA